MTIEDRVRRVLTQAVATEPPPRGAPLERTLRRRRRRPVLVGATAVVLVLAAVAGLVALRQPDRVVPAAPTLTTLPTAGWPEVVDQAGNFRFRYPPGWEARRVRSSLWALAPRGISRTGEGLPAFEVRVTAERGLWRSYGFWRDSSEVGRLPAGQAYVFAWNVPAQYGTWFVDWGRRCTRPAAPGSCRPYSVQVEFRSFTGTPPWNRYRAEVQALAASLRQLRPTAPTVGDRSRPACRTEQWELARPDVLFDPASDVLTLPVGVRFRGGRPCHLRAPVSMAVQQEGQLVEVRGNPAPATIELDLPEDALPATYLGHDRDRMLQAWVWNHPCQSPRPPPRPVRFRRVDLVFSDDRGRRLQATNFNQTRDDPTCGDRGRPSVVAAWP
jgi:hypothetical protein